MCELQNHITMSSNYDFEGHQQHSKWYLTVAKLLYHNLEYCQVCHLHVWVLPLLLPDFPYHSTFVSSAPSESEDNRSGPVNSESLSKSLPDTTEDN